MPDSDVIVMGAGHNALVTAAYAARAGLRVGVFEAGQQSRVGADSRQCVTNAPRAAVTAGGGVIV